MSGGAGRQRKRLRSLLGRVEARVDGTGEMGEKGGVQAG
jgi:hypothetical protein